VNVYSLCNLYGGKRFVKAIIAVQITAESANFPKESVPVWNRYLFNLFPISPSIRIPNLFIHFPIFSPDQPKCGNGETGTDLIRGNGETGTDFGTGTDFSLGF